MTQHAVVRSSQRFRRALLPFEKRSTRFKLTLIGVLVCLVVPRLILAVDDTDSTAIGTLTVEETVRDIACPLQNQKSTSTSHSNECITACLKAGSPLGILTSDGSVYIPVTESMPDTGQNALKPYVGEQVKATGRVFLEKRHTCHRNQRNTPVAKW